MQPQDDIATRSLERVRTIVLDALKGSGAAVWLFGSWARGDTARHSDIDVAVDGRGRLPLGVLAAIRDRLEESSVPYRVDLVDLADVSETFRQRVQHEGVRWTN